jgi:signal transduction histidine kinase
MLKRVLVSSTLDSDWPSGDTSPTHATSMDAPSPASGEWLSEPLDSHRLARAWQEHLTAPTSLQPHGLIVSLAALLATDCDEAAALSVVSQFGKELGRRRFEEHATLDTLLGECHGLTDACQTFIDDTAHSSAGEYEADVVWQARRRLMRACRAFEHHALTAYVGHYTAIVEQQTAQLRSFSRLVGHEMRRPLSVLRVIARTLTVNLDDMDGARTMDIFDRSVAHLIQVTGELERLARLSRATDVMPREQRVALSAVARDVARQLHEVATARGVIIRIADDLPVLHLDAARAELVFLTLLANAVKHADRNRVDRWVEVCRVPDATERMVVIRDNGVGIPGDTLRAMFREQVRGRRAQGRDDGGPRLGGGLALVGECMQAVKGQVRVESRVGEGTTVTLIWPPPHA